MVRATAYLMLASGVTAQDKSGANTLTALLFTDNGCTASSGGTPFKVGSAAASINAQLNKAEQGKCQQITHDTKKYSMKLSCSTVADGKMNLMVYTTQDKMCEGTKVDVAMGEAVSGVAKCHTTKPFTLNSDALYMQTTGVCFKPTAAVTTAAPATSGAFSQSVAASLFGSIGMAAAWLLA